MSAAISPGGYSRAILNFWLLERFEMVVSYDLLLELEAVLLRDKFRKRLTVTDVLSYVEYLRERATVIPSRGNERAPGGPVVPDPDDEYLVHLAEDAQADRIVSGDKDFRELPQADTPIEFFVALIEAEKEKLLTQIPAYYSAYFSELRSQLDRSDVFTEAVPDWMRGYKRVVTVSGRDGVVVVHFPRIMEISIDRADGTNLLRFSSEPNAFDHSYEFIAFLEESVSVLANLIGGGEDIEIGIDPDVPWGVRGFSRPQQRANTSGGLAELTWEAPWSRIVAADFYSLLYFEDPERARAEARADTEPYIQQGESP